MSDIFLLLFLATVFALLAASAVAIGGGLAFMVWFRAWWFHEASTTTKWVLMSAMALAFTYVYVLPALVDLWRYVSSPWKPVGIEKVTSVGESFERLEKEEIR